MFDLLSLLLCITEIGQLILETLFTWALIRHLGSELIFDYCIIKISHNKLQLLYLLFLLLRHFTTLYEIFHVF